MDPRQRLLATIRGEAHDRVPLMLAGFLHRDREGIDAVADEGRRQIAGRVFEHTHYWVPCYTMVNRWLVTPGQFIRQVSSVERDGGVEVTRQIDTPAGSLTAILGRDGTSDTWWTKKYPCESLADIEKIRSVPWELPAGIGPPDGEVFSGDDVLLPEEGEAEVPVLVLLTATAQHQLARLESAQRRPCLLDHRGQPVEPLLKLWARLSPLEHAPPLRSIP